MRSRSLRLAVPAAAISLALVGGACSKSSDTSTGGSSTTAGGSGTTIAGPTIDYAKLSGTLNGSGSTFQKVFNEDAIEAFGEKAPGVTVNYAGGGSGKGKKDLADQLVQWAGTDSLVKDEDKASFKGGEFLYFPTVAAPITISYNLKGVDKLQLSPDTLAKIFERKVTSWDASEIKADNPDATLPSEPIVVVHRSDGSGTTSTFTKYLDSAAKGTWTLGSGDTVNWPADTQAGNGNAGVAQTVQSTEGAVGYVDFADAETANLTTAAIKNKDGKYVDATLEGATAAMAGAEVKDNLTFSALNTAGAEAYPITAGTYVLVYQKQTDKAVGEALRGWLAFLLTDGQGLANDAGFAPLPAGLRDKAIAQLDKLQIG